MSQFKPSDFSLLLEVFREGLLRGLISKEEVVAWVDEIIKAEEEPDYFFIEISLAGNTNSLLEILGEYVVASESVIPSRVILGLLNQKITDQTINIEKAIDVLNNVNSDNKITPFEKGRIYSIDDHCDYIIYSGNDSDYVEITNSTKEFVSYYSGFTLTNYHNWTEINKQVEERLQVAATEQTIANEILMAEYAEQNRVRQKKNKIKRICLYVMIGILILPAIYILLVAFKVITGKYRISKFERGLFSFSGGALYPVLRIAYVLWKRVRVRRW